jgi:predicted  nucleic acid-binding Zn-ribbon protein
MQTDLEFLVKLQQHDVAVDEAAQRVEAALPAIKAKNAQIEKLKNDLKSAKDSLTSHAKKKKELELEVDSKEQLVRKHQGELNNLKSNDAYKAMLGEIEAAKKEQAKIEDDILVLMEQADADEKKYKEGEKQFKTEEARLKGELQQLESAKGILDAEVAKLKAERDAFAATVPEKVRQQYEGLRETRGTLVIAPVVNNSCGGCRMNITASKGIELKKGKNMVVCDNCSRILYLPAPEGGPAVSAPASTPAAS